MSVLAALVLWFHVSTAGTFSTQISLPIHYIKPVQGLMVADAAPERVLVLVRGSGRALFTYTLKRFFDQTKQYVLVNLAVLPKGENQITIDKSDVALGVEGLEVENTLENDNFTIVLDHKIRRTVAVDADSLPGLKVEKGTVVLGHPAVEPRFVLLEGPESILRTITKIRVASLIRSEVSLSDTVLQGKLDTKLNPFVEVQPKVVDIRFAVEPLVTKVIAGVPVRLKGFPDRRKYTADPESLDVEVRGPASVIARLERGDLDVFIPYQPFLKRTADGDNSLRPEIVYPKGVAEVSSLPETVRVAPRKDLAP